MAFTFKYVPGCSWLTQLPSLHSSSESRRCCCSNNLPFQLCNIAICMPALYLYSKNNEQSQTYLQPYAACISFAQLPVCRSIRDNRAKCQFQFLGFPEFPLQLQINSPTSGQRGIPLHKACNDDYLLQNHTNFLLRRVIKDMPEDH